MTRSEDGPWSSAAGLSPREATRQRRSVDAALGNTAAADVSRTQLAKYTPPLQHPRQLTGAPADYLPGLAVVFGGGCAEGRGLLTDSGGRRAPGLVIWEDCGSPCSKTLADD